MIKLAYALLNDAASGWSRDNAMRRSAALAYYALFSLAPLIVIVTAIAGILLGRRGARTEIAVEIGKLAGDQVARAILALAHGAEKHRSGVVAASIGTVALLLGASGVFGELKSSLNSIWEVKVRKGATVATLARNRLLAFGMVLGIGFLMILSLVASTVIAGVATYLRRLLPIPGWILGASDFALSLAVLTVLFAMVFKFLPDVELRWRDVATGAFGSALLFNVGKFLLSIYLGTSGVASAYGAAGSAIVTLLWLYYSSAILFFGAEFTKALARHTGCKITPKPYAVPVSEADNASGSGSGGTV